MKKRFFVCVAMATLALFLVTGPAMASDNYLSGKVGVGYQGMLAGDLINGISVRGWVNDNFGLEGSFFYGGVSAEYEGYDIADADVALFEAKVMYAFVVKSNSRFYIGAKVGYGMVDLEVENYTVLDDDMWSLGAFIGAEWNLSEVPELGLNFDIGYSYLNYSHDVDGVDVEIDLDGIAATFGIHYYF